MRPVSLHIEGFGIFREPVDLDFEGVDYFALVGPTGAGKSTVIDAICFALYGSVPRYGDERLVHRAVSAGGLQARVSLTFDIGADRYQATRVVRVKNGKATTPEALLERVRADGSELLAGRAREMRPAVERLLGLPFAHFTKCVVLPQGEFARFLHDDPAKRRELLSRLLDLQIYERVGQRARELAKGAEHAIGAHERQLGEYAFATGAAHAAADARVKGLRELFRRVDAARPRDDELAAASQAAGASGRRAKELTALLANVGVPERAAAIAVDAEAARIALSTATDARAFTTEAVATADARRDTLGDHADLLRARDAHVELETLAQRASAAAEEAHEARDTVERARALVATAEEGVAAAEQEQAAAHDLHSAHAIAAHLVAGEPCPVCAQTVTQIPKRRRPPALTKAEAGVTKAGALREQARAALDRAVREQADHDAALRQLETRREVLTSAVGAHPDAPQVQGALDEIDAATTACTAARAADQRARDTEAHATAHMRALQQRIDGVRDEYRQRRDVFVREGLDAPAPSDDPAADWRALATWAGEQVIEQQGVATAAAESLARAHEQRGQLVSKLAAKARELGIDIAGGDLGMLRDAVIKDGQDAANERDRIVDAIEKAAKLTGELQAAREEHDVAQLLGESMRSNRFEKWVLAEAIELLVDAASVTLLALSAGQYSLRYSPDDEFCVVDHANADEMRSVKTLSGGETFQASLALALALSDQIAELSAAGGTKLEAIFLDEGFGTLDADTLDAVATTIETLGTSGRMVGVITHVPALAERVAVRFRVARVDHSATVTREES